MFRNAALCGSPILACAAIAAALVGCSDGEPMKPKAPALCVSSSGWFIGGRGGISPVMTVANCGGGSLSWTAQAEAAWLSLSRPAGTAPGSFQIIAAPNRTEVPRSQSIVVAAAGASNSPHRIVVSQGTGLSSLCISTDELIVPSEGVVSAPVEVENCGTDNPFGWSASEDIGWMSLSRNDGSAPGDFSIVVPPNYSAVDRSGRVTVTAAGIDGSPKTIFVSQPFSLLAKPRHYEVGYGPISLSVADLDGDGDTDIVVGNALTDDICVLKNRGDGTLAPPRFHLLPVSPSAILCADIDGDRKRDIVVRSSQRIMILKNFGDGTFGMPFAVPVGTNPVSLAAADIDSDGDDDLAVVDDLRPVITILTGRGDGTLSEPTLLDLSKIDGVPMGICFVDVDRDLDQDIVAVAEFSSGYALVVVKNRGNGTFEDPIFNRSARLGGTCAMMAADFDRDGDNDIALVNGLGCGAPYLAPYLIVFKNRNGGIFEEVLPSWEVGWATVALSAADLDLDGDVDIVSSSRGDCENVSVLRNDGTGSFGAPAYFTAGLDPSAIACADFDGDGDVDVAVANSGSYTGVYTITVLQNFTRGPSTVAAK